MRKWLVILVLFPVAVYSQQMIESSKGYKKIVLGMGVSSMEKLQPSISKMNYTEEKAEWVDRGYVWDEELVSQIEFDEAYSYSLENAYGLWTMYTNKGKVVIIQISKRYFPYSAYPYPSIDNKVNFGASVEDIEKAYGTDYVKQVDHNNTISMHYLPLGISFYVWETGGLTTVHIFEKLDGNKLSTAKRKMGKLTPAEN